MKLEEKVDLSKYWISLALEKFTRFAVAWTGGKDSTALLQVVREILGEGALPPVVFIDTSVKFPEVYQFRDDLAAEWGLDLVIARNDEALKTLELAADVKECCHQLKTVALLQAIEREKWDAVFTGIRHDEHPARSSETYFSPRQGHTRVHPLLHWSEEDIWAFTASRNLPYNPLYDRGYRSLGCRPCTQIDPAAERAGRAQDKEHVEVMGFLRQLGYM